LTVPTFSAVIPAYNAGSMVQSAIRSVVAQTREDWELLVVDDGSQDDTFERARELADDGRITCLRQENQGQGAARNLGIQHARGTYVSFLDSDDLWMPTYLESMGDALERVPEAGLAYTDAWSLDDETRRIHRATAMSGSRPPVEAPSDHEQLLLRLVANNFILSSATVRREVLQEVGDFDPTFRAAQDYELWLRIVRAGHDVVRARGLLAIQRERADSWSKREELTTRCLIRAMEGVIRDGRLSDDVRGLAQRRQRRLERYLAAITGTNRLYAGAYRMRKLAGRGRRLVVRSRATYKTPPEEVSRAYPDLSKV
jgi:glycosyltransferase involved in cell wall biosynthesis